MRLSQFPLSTLKETPNDAEIVSHQLMLRAGMIRAVAAGLYTWLPLGLKVLKKTENIVREEMNKAGAIELLMPTVQPADLWRKTKRWDEFGAQLLKFTDRHQREFCYGPTHEEVITDFARKELHSYRQLPLNYYQIQLKFRDEIRPRFGVMRAREFLMKDAYSFHTNAQCLDETYQKMHAAYSKILQRIGLKYRAVDADPGAIGGNKSQEFHVLATSGEDEIALCSDSGFAANIELAPCYRPPTTKTEQPALAAVEKIATFDNYSVEQVAKFLNIDAAQIAKTLLVKGKDCAAVALVVQGSGQLNELKAAKHPQVDAPLTFLNDAEIEQICGAKAGSIGPVGLDIPVIVDYKAWEMSSFYCGANENDHHLANVNWQRDVPTAEAFDLRYIEAGDLCPSGKGKIEIVRGIEVGHIFQLNDKYSSALGATVLDENGDEKAMLMGCYGIGVSRIVAASIEQNHDQHGIVWPAAIAPLSLAIVPIGDKNSNRVAQTSAAIYQKALQLGIDVALDDRDARLGVKLNDMELIGVAHIIIVGERGLKAGNIEYKQRTTTDKQTIKIDKIDNWLQSLAKQDN